MGFTLLFLRCPNVNNLFQVLRIKTSDLRVVVPKSDKDCPVFLMCGYVYNYIEKLLSMK